MAHACLVAYIADFTKMDALTRNSNTYALNLILKRVMPSYTMNMRVYSLYYLNGFCTYLVNKYNTVG